jgi:hypothetical protein
VLHRPITAALCLALAGSSSVAFAAEPLVFEGEVPEEGNFFDVEFQVPAGTEELEIRHDDLASENILDWGLEDPTGFRGYGGGNEEPAIVARTAASRSYLAGALPAGTWKVTVGKAKINKRPARYRIEVHLRDTQTLAPQPERGPYVQQPPLESGDRWYAGDFHVHSRESGDARPELDELATYARSRGLDFVHLSDHNTTSTLDFLADAQGRHPSLLLVPGVEYTTYRGHANAIGATRYVSPRIGEELSLDDAVADFRAQGAIFSINHPTYDVADNCIGCAWENPLPAGGPGAVEIATGGWDKMGRFFSESAIAYWDWVLSQGHHAAAIGGSDDHRAGKDPGLTGSPISEPTTLVHAKALSVPALLEGIRDGRTVVKLQGMDDPMVELSSDVAPTGDTVLAERARFRATVTGGVGATVRFVHNGTRLEEVRVDADPFEIARDFEAPEGAEDRVRAEVWVDGRVRTVTSHLWLATSSTFRGTPGPAVAAPDAAAGCACGAVPAASTSLFGLAGLALLAARGLRRRE